MAQTYHAASHAISTESFTVNTKNKTLIVERSQLPPGHERQIYPDACDVGIALVSHKTGCSVWFVWSHEIRDKRDNELMTTVYKPTPETIRAYPNLYGWALHVLND